MEDLIARVQNLLPRAGESLNLSSPLAEGERYEVLSSTVSGGLPAEMVISVICAEPRDDDR